MCSSIEDIMSSKIFPVLHRWAGDSVSSSQILWLHCKLSFFFIIFVLLVSVFGLLLLSWLSHRSLKEWWWDSSVRTERGRIWWDSMWLCSERAVFLFTRWWIPASKDKVFWETNETSDSAGFAGQRLLCLLAQQHNTPPSVNNWYHTSPRRGQGQGKYSLQLYLPASISSVLTPTTYFLT